MIRSDCISPKGARRGFAAARPILACVAAAALLLPGAHSALADPSVSSITPTSGSTAGGYKLTIAGSGFSASGNSVSVDGNCPIALESSNLIICTAPEGSGAVNDLVVTDSTGIVSTPKNFAYDPPSISSLSPSSASTVGGTVITIHGDNFGPAGADALRSVSLGAGGASCDVVPGGGSHTSVECTVPEGEGSGLALAIRVDGQSSNSASFSYDAPSILSVMPSSGSTAGGNVLTISGSNFGVAPSALVGTTPCPISSHSHTEVQCTAPAGMAGGTTVTVSAGGQASNAAAYAYVDPPSILSVFPSHGPTAGGVQITISGSHFSASGNLATVDGNDCPVSQESDSMIVCQLPKGTGAGVDVGVVSGGWHSNPVQFDYDAPVVSSVLPSSGPTQGSIPLTINGLNFGPVDADALRKVTVGTADCPLVAMSSSDSKIVCTLPPGQGLGRTVAVTVDSQDGSTTGSFDYNPPSIDSVTPNRGPLAGGTVITISGSNFGLVASVAIAGSDCPVSMQSHSSVVCTTPPGSGTGVTLRVDVSGQHADSTFDYANPVCGDTYVDTAAGEVCDDGNNTNLDGCSAQCESESIESKDQAGCIVAMNKAGAGVVKAVAKQVAACAKGTSAGVVCIGAASSSVDKSKTKVQAASDLKCGQTPHFGVAPVSDVQDGNVEEALALAADLFGANPDAPLVPDAMAPGRQACQQAIVKAVGKLEAASLKAFGKCKKEGLKITSIRAASELSDCLSTIGPDTSVTKAVTALADALQADCTGESLSTDFPGECAAAADFAGCVEQRLRCRTCRMLSRTDAFPDVCDSYDDVLLNSSCP